MVDRHPPLQEPQSIGQSIDAHTGLPKPQVFSQAGVNAQFIVEGMTAGTMFALGSAGFILLDLAKDVQRPHNWRMLGMLAGTVMIGGSFNMCVLFLRIKLPNYMVAS
eukprot:SAG11_NODE_1085_length_5939_cov_9.908390_5_plen_107_part_00